MFVEKLGFLNGFRIARAKEDDCSDFVADVHADVKK